MEAIILTPSIVEEIKKSIQDFDALISKEMAFSADLRNHKKIIIYTQKIIELQQALVNGYI